MWRDSTTAWTARSSSHSFPSSRGDSQGWEDEGDQDNAYLGIESLVWSSGSCAATRHHSPVFNGGSEQEEQEEVDEEEEEVDEEEQIPEE